MTVRLDEDVKDRLELLAEATQRSKSFLAAEAIRAFVDTNEWQVAEITVALKEAGAGDFASDKDIATLVRKWKEKARWLPAPGAAQPRFRSLVHGDRRSTGRATGLARLREAVASLADQSALLRPGRVAGTPELVVRKTWYIVAYRVRQETVEILRVVHASRRLPEQW